MRIIDSCVQCLYERQANITDNKEYLARIKELLDTRDENDTAPYMVYQFNKVYEEYFGKKASFNDVKKKYNDLVLSMEDSIRGEIVKSEDPLAKALLYARVGNYIDFGAMNNVDEKTFIALFDHVSLSTNDAKTYASFISQCESAERFLLITDNCGEIVLDKLFLEQLKARFPKLSIDALVRGKEALNDATLEDALYVGLDNIAALYSNGEAIAGTVTSMLPPDAKKILERADVILSKGQGNYESMCDQGMHIFYSFLCKCERFTTRFNVPRLTGMFIEEYSESQKKSLNLRELKR